MNIRARKLWYNKMLLESVVPTDIKVIVAILRQCVTACTAPSTGFLWISQETIAWVCCAFANIGCVYSWQKLL